jgi:NADPH-dependent curcumin reductase CurA
MADSNRQWTLVKNPVGEPTPDDFELKESAIPEPGEGEALARTLYLSLDPYMRGRISAQKGYAEGVAPGDVIVGGTVSQVVKSRNPEIAEGTIIADFGGWQEYSIYRGAKAQPLDPKLAPLPAYLGVLGMPGYTGYWGLMKIGEPKPDETVVVSSAAGAVGSIVGQLAKHHGCRTVGIAGGTEKCKLAEEQFGYDTCVDYKSGDLKAKLREACPDGIDVYFENVGGDVQKAVLPLLNVGARVPLCGMIAQYNATEIPPGPNWAMLLVNRIKVQGFIISDHFDRMGEFFKEVGPLVGQGNLHHKEDIVDGLEKAPEAFIGLLQGRNFGKLVVHVADPE